MLFPSGSTVIWEAASSFPFLNHLRVMFLGEKPWELQVKFTVCSGEALAVGPDTTGGEGLATRGAFMNSKHDCGHQHQGYVCDTVENPPPS